MRQPFLIGGGKFAGKVEVGNKISLFTSRYGGGRERMEELIGHCRKCEKPVYCKMGFLDGVVQADKSLLCFNCSEEESAKESD
ncbi:hypothetical protein D3C86_1999770 [compost metagenome]